MANASCQIEKSHGVQYTPAWLSVRSMQWCNFRYQSMYATGPDFASAVKSKRDMIGRFQRQIQLKSCCIFDHMWVIFGQVREFARKGFLQEWWHKSLTYTPGKSRKYTRKWPHATGDNLTCHHGCDFNNFCTWHQSISQDKGAKQSLANEFQPRKI